MQVLASFTESFKISGHLDRCPLTLLNSTDIPITLLLLYLETSIITKTIKEISHFQIIITLFLNPWSICYTYYFPILPK